MEQYSEPITEQYEPQEASQRPFRKVVAGAIAIVVLSSAVGMAFDLLTPKPRTQGYGHPTSSRNGPKGRTLVSPAHARVPQVSLTVAKALFQHGQAIFIDARSRQDFAKGRISGAVSLPNSDFDKQSQRLLRKTPKTARIVVYCQSASCGMSAALTERLIKSGYKLTRDFAGGWQEWCEAGLPIQGLPYAAPSNAALPKGGQP